MMKEHIAFALTHPVFEPERDIMGHHGWVVDRSTSALLTVNIGME